MRILHVYKDYPPVIGGIENHIKVLAEEQVARGLEVTVLVTSLNRSTVIKEIEGVHVIKAARLTQLASTPLSLSFFFWLRRLEPDITHLHFPYPPGEIGHCVLSRGSRLVITYHSDVVRQKLLLTLYRRALKRVLNRADRIIVTSPNYVQSSPFLMQVPDKCEVIPLGIDWAPFVQADPKEVEAVKGRYGGPLLLFVGRLRYYKGLNYLVEAMSTIEARLIIVGTGPEEKSCRTLAEKSGVSDRIFFAGGVSAENLPAYFHACDVFVLPASHRSEAFGLAQLEAMAAGIPVVCTELGTGTSFVNQHGETGLVAPARNSEALSGAINKLLGDPERRRRLGENGRLRVKEEFSKDRMVERTIDLYNNLVR